MSSVYDRTTVPSNVNDGALVVGHSTCALTHKEASPWWIVELLGEYQVLYVRILNRLLGRSQPFDVRVGNSYQDGGVSNNYCVEQKSNSIANTLIRFDCPYGTKGRYVSYHTAPHISYLDLCEVEVYGFMI